MLVSETVEILAHQGGWDELALFGGPVLVMVVLGYLARRGVIGADADADADADVDVDDDIDDDGAKDRLQTNQSGPESIDSTEGGPDSTPAR